MCASFAVMLKAFQMFDVEKKGYIDTFKVGSILKAMNLDFDKDELGRTIEEYDTKSILIKTIVILPVFITHG